MKWLLTIGLLLAAPLVHAKGEPAYLEVKDFSCGVDTYHDPLAINDCYVQDALNVYFDKDAPITKRGGYTLSFSTKSYSYSGQWSYTDNSGNIWMIVRSSDQISATTGVGTSLFNIKVATVSANNVVAEQSAFGNAYFVDQSQGVYYWNGTSTTYVANSPLGSLIAEYHGRIWVSGLAAPYGSRVQASKYLDGTTWSTSAPSLTTDPVSITVSLADNYDITSCMFSGFNDSLYIFENTHINQLTGFDSTNFNVAQIGKEVGCIQQGSIQQYQGGLVFASLRGFEFFDGYNATRISDPIKDKVDPSTLNSSFGQNSWVQQNATDWNAGTVLVANSLSSTTYSPGLSVSTFSATSYVSSTVVVSAEIPNYSFESGGASSADNWTLAGGFSRTTGITLTHCGAVTAKDGSYFILHGLGIADEALGLYTNPGAVLISSANINADTQTCGWTAVTINGSAAAGQNVILRITDVFSGVVAVTDPFVANGNNITIYYQSDNFGAGWRTLYDYVQGAPVLFSTKVTSTTAVFDSQLQNSVAQLNAAWSSGVTSAAYTLYTASSATGVFSSIATSTGTNVNAKRYFIVASTLNFTTSGTISSTNTIIAASSGTWASASHNISTATAFGNLTVTQTLGGGTIAYAVCQSTVSTMAGKLCAAIAPNAQITVSTNIFVQVIATFTVTAATNTPTLNNVAVNWYTGTRKPPMASTVFDNRYWVSLTTDTADSINDATLVLSKGPIWTIFDIKAGAFVVWKNSLYFADANSTGGAYQLEQGYNDNGAAIDSFIRTKAYAPKGIINDKFFEELWIVAQNGGHFPITTSYTIDQSTSTFTLGSAYMDEVPGAMISRLSLPISTSYQNFGKVIDFKFRQNDVDAPFKFFGGTLRYRKRPPL